MLRLLSSVVIFAAVSGAGLSDARHTAALRVQTNLALVTASVVDDRDRFVTDLGKDAFRVFEHGAEQRIVSFAVEDAPMSVAIVLDASGSMKDVMTAAGEAVRALTETSNPGDEFSVVTVHDRPELSLGFVRDPQALLSRVRDSAAHGETALLDSVYLAANYLERKGVNTRKALLVISDGEDNHSRYTEAELLRVLRESDSTLYAVGVGTSWVHESIPEGEWQPSGADILTDLAEATGGRYFEVAGGRDLVRIMRRLDIRYQYVLGFEPAPLRADGRYHRVQVKLSREARGRRLHAYWRPGYYAPDTAPGGHRQSAQAEQDQARGFGH